MGVGNAARVEGPAVEPGHFSLGSVDEMAAAVLGG